MRPIFYLPISMFTGLVESLGKVVSVEKQGEQAWLNLSIPFATELQLGDSVAVNGCCLTVAELGAGCVRFDVLAQTLRVTLCLESYTSANLPPPILCICSYTSAGE